MSFIDDVKNNISAGVGYIKDEISSTKFQKIEKFDTTGTEIVQRFPERGTIEGKIFGLHLIVRENQSAIFFANGRAMDVFGPGMHDLTTNNLPLVSSFINNIFDGRSPFSYEVYFINHKVYNDLKWGTKEPVNFRDTDFGFIRLRAFGNFSMRVGHGDNVNLFINKLVGTQNSYNTASIEGFLKNIIVARLNDVLGETLKNRSILDLPQYYDEISVALKARVKDDFGKYGLELIDFLIGAITPPPNVQEMMDKRTGMAALGIKDMSQYGQFQAAEAMANISKQPGGGNSIMGQSMQLGMGLAAGMMMPQMLHGQQQQQPQPQAQPVQQQVVVPQSNITCPTCKVQLPEGAKFCASCGNKIQEGVECPNCKAQLPAGAKFCMSCGTKIDQEVLCPGCQTKLPPGAKFCLSCGNKIS